MRPAHQHAVLDAGLARYVRVASNYAQLAHTGSGLYHRALADKAGRRNVRMFAHSRARHYYGARVVGRLPAQRLVHAAHAAGQRVKVGLRVGGRIAYVAPVTAHHPAVHGPALAHRTGQQLAPEVVLPGRYHLQHIGLHYVYARVHRIGKHLAPARLFDKAPHAPALVGLHHAVFQRHRHPLEHDGNVGRLAPVEFQRRRQVAVRQPVAREHAERLVQEPGCRLHPARRAQRRLFDMVPKLHAPARAVAEVVAYAVGHIAQRDRRASHAVALEQAQRIVHYGPVQHGHHGLGHIAGKRAQPRALASGHYNSFHDILLR